jgi:hypothetical protein
VIFVAVQYSEKFPALYFYSVHIYHACYEDGGNSGSCCYQEVGNSHLWFLHRAQRKNQPNHLACMVLSVGGGGRVAWKEFPRLERNV